VQLGRAREGFGLRADEPLCEKPVALHPARGLNHSAVIVSLVRRSSSTSP
jgi:hypothetical protein